MTIINWSHYTCRSFVAVFWLRQYCFLPQFNPNLNYPALSFNLCWLNTLWTCKLSLSQTLCCDTLLTCRLLAFTVTVCMMHDFKLSVHTVFPYQVKFIILKKPPWSLMLVDVSRLKGHIIFKSVNRNLCQIITHWVIRDNKSQPDLIKNSLETILIRNSLHWKLETAFNSTTFQKGIFLLHYIYLIVSATCYFAD